MALWDNVRQDVTSEDIETFLENWRFVQILADRIEGVKESLKLPIDDQASPAFLLSYDSNWPIQYWVGNDDLASMMATSAGEMLLGGLAMDKSSEFGTDTSHAAKAAISMVHYASLQKWPGIVIVEGSEFLKWVVWATADNYGIPCRGFEPNSDDIAKKDRCSYLLTSFKPENRIISSFSYSQGSGDGLGEETEE